MGSVRVLALRIPRSALCPVVILLLLLLTMATSCGGGAALPEKPAVAPAGGLESLPPPSSLRLATYAPAQLMRNGCDYLWGPGFPQQNASAVDLNCELKPSWTPADPDFAGLAFACYGFDMTDYDRPGMITFTWAEQGDPADLWIGLSDFTRDCWSWHSLSGGNTLEVALQDFVDPASKLMLVLPLVTGTAPWSLNLIQLGDLASVSGIVYADEYGTPLENAEVVLHAFAGPAILASAFAPTYDFFTYFFVLAITPMFMLCGVFYPINTFPETLQHFVYILPLTHAVELTRPIITGQELHNPLLNVLVLLLYAVVGYYLAVVFTRKRLMQ